MLVKRGFIDLSDICIQGFYNACYKQFDISTTGLVDHSITL